MDKLLFLSKQKAKDYIKTNKQKSQKILRLSKCYYYILKDEPEYNIIPLNMILPYLASKKLNDRIKSSTSSPQEDAGMTRKFLKFAKL